jgi:hypothetical protein
MNKNKELGKWKKVDYSDKKGNIFSTKYFRIFKLSKN